MVRWGVKRGLALFVLVAFTLETTGCRQFIGHEHISEPFTALLEVFKQEGSQRELRWARHLDQIGRDIQRVASEIPELDGKLRQDLTSAEKFVRTNRTRIQKWLDRVEAQARRIREVIYDLSQHAYQSNQDREIVRDYSLLAFALHYHRHLFSKLIELASPLMIGMSSKDFEKSKELKDFRKFLLDRYFSYLGVVVVLNQDITEVLQVLGDYRQHKELPVNLELIIELVRKNIEKKIRPQINQLNGAIADLKVKDRRELVSKVEKFLAEFRDASLLYQPGLGRNVVLAIISWIGNLTWGLINTVIGIGVIIGFMIASPFSKHIHFPSFRLSSSGAQIYVHVSDSVPAKFSIGLFEFDMAGRYTTKSHHEAGHALQSAVLGPFYLPVVLASYLTAGWGNGFIERWADAWAVH